MTRRVVNERGLRLGQDHQNARLKQVQADEAFALRDEGWTQQAIADRYGVSRSTVRDVLSGRSWNKTAAVAAPWQPGREEVPVWTFAALAAAWSPPTA